MLGVKRFIGLGTHMVYELENLQLTFLQMFQVPRYMLISSLTWLR
jgi:hypothetical protein